MNYVHSDVALRRIVLDYMRRNPGVKSWIRCKRELRHEAHARGEKLAAGWRIREAWRALQRRAR
jgi:hypothetical protein